MTRLRHEWPRGFKFNPDCTCKFCEDEWKEIRKKARLNVLNQFRKDFKGRYVEDAVDEILRSFP